MNEVENVRHYCFLRNPASLYGISAVTVCSMTAVIDIGSGLLVLT